MLRRTKWLPLAILMLVSLFALAALTTNASAVPSNSYVPVLHADFSVPSDTLPVNPNADEVIASFGGKNITLGEFERAYFRNTGKLDAVLNASFDDYKNFLDLYVNYRMKLADAEGKGYEQIPELKAEVLLYKDQVGSSYLLEKVLVDPGIEKLYERRLKEYRVSHIMIRPDTTGFIGAKKKADEVIAKLKAGETFESLAAKYSEDRYSAAQGGDIYYITGGMVVPEFEDAMFSLKPGEVFSDPVKTVYGYHIIRLDEIRDRIPKIRASHILVNFLDASGNRDSLRAKMKIDSIKTLLNNGANFEDLARSVSEDQASGQKGGDLSYIERRTLVKELDQIVFSAPIGAVSDPVASVFGYHILKVTEHVPMPTLKESYEEIKKLYRQTRFDYDKKVFVENLKKKFGAEASIANFNKIVKLTDTLKAGPDYDTMPWRSEVKDLPLVTIQNQKVTVDDLMRYLGSQANTKGKKITGEVVQQGIDYLTEQIVLNKESADLDKRDPRFADLMEEYKNGIYIFKLQEDEVWKKVVLDSTKLYGFWERTQNDYTWKNDRVTFAEIYVKSDSLMNVITEQLKNGVPFDTLAVRYTERPGFKIKNGKHVLIDVTTMEQAKKAAELTPGAYSQSFKVTGGNAVVMLLEKDAARTKTFFEARPEVSGLFQEAESKRLEKEYLDTLMQKFSPTKDYEKLRHAYNK